MLREKVGNIPMGVAQLAAQPGPGAILHGAFAIPTVQRPYHDAHGIATATRPVPRLIAVPCAIAAYRLPPQRGGGERADDARHFPVLGVGPVAARPQPRQQMPAEAQTPPIRTDLLFFPTDLLFFSYHPISSSLFIII